MFRLRVAAWSVAVFLLSQATIGQELWSKAEFLAIYEPAFNKLAERYRHGQFQARYSRSAYRSQPDQEVEFRVLLSGDKLRFDRQYVRGPDAGKRRSSVANPAVSFGVEANAEQAFQVADMSSDLSEAMSHARTRCPIAVAPFGYFESTILDYLRLDQVAVEAIEESNVDGERRVCVRYVKPGASANMTRHGRMVFLPDRCWALREHVIFLGTEQDDVPDQWTTLEYSHDIDNVPIVKVLENFYRSPKRKLNIDRYEVVSFDPATPADDQFSLPAFGLPDVEQARPGISRYLLVGIGAAVFLLGAVIWAVIRVRR